MFTSIPLIKLTTSYCTAIILFIIILSGCSHYSLVKSENLPFSTLSIEPVINTSYAPQSQASLSQNIIEAFIKDGTIKIVDRSVSDAHLKVVIVNYDRNLSSTQETDTILGRSFNLNLEATATLTNNKTSENFFSERSFIVGESAFSESSTDNGLQQAEYQTIPILTQSLARKIKDAVLSVW